MIKAVPFVALASLAFAQDFSFYRDKQGDLAIWAKEGQATVLKSGYQFDLKTNVRIASKKQGYSLKADRVVAVVNKGKGAAADQIQTAKATGRVSMDQTAGTRQSNLQCASADYKSLGDTAQVDARGGVKIRNLDGSKKQTILAEGTSGTAILDKNHAQGSGLRLATLTGSVRVEIVEANQNNAQMVFTGNRLTMDANKITLSGNVRAKGKGQSAFGEGGPFDTVVVNLKDQKFTSLGVRKGGTP